MTLGNDPHSNLNPSDDRRVHGDDHLFAGDAYLPSAPSPCYNRNLVDAYFSNCRHGFVQEFELITNRTEMDYEDRLVLDRMESDYRTIFKRKLQQFGLSDKGSDVTVRVLHPVVAVGPTRREYHLYLDIVSGNGRCWFLDFDSAAPFERGPAALQISSLGPQGKNKEMVVTRLFSEPAFLEAAERLVNAPFQDVVRNPRDFVAFGWIVQAIATAQNGGAARDDLRGSTTPRPLRLSDISDLSWTGQARPFTFDCLVGNALYVAEVHHDQRTRQPYVALHEEGF